MHPFRKVRTAAPDSRRSPRAGCPGTVCGGRRRVAGWGIMPLIITSVWMNPLAVAATARVVTLQPSPSCHPFSHPAAAARSASHLELFALPAGAERPKSSDLTAAAAAEQQALEAALTERVVAKVVAASQQEAHDLVASVAAKYGLVGDYGRAEETIKAVWGQRVSEPGRPPAAGCWGRAGAGRACCRCSTSQGLLLAVGGHCVASTAAANSHPPSCHTVLQPNASRANSAADGLPAAAKHPASQQQQQTGGAEELTLGKGSSDHASGDEEAGQQATSTLKPLAPVSAALAAAAAGSALRCRSLPCRCLPAVCHPTHPLNLPADPADQPHRRRGGHRQQAPPGQPAQLLLPRPQPVGRGGGGRSRRRRAEEAARAL